MPLLTTSTRTSIVAALFCASVLASPTAEPSARAASPDDSMQCDRAGEPGRVRCTVEVRPSEGTSISWAEVEILSVPEFVVPLRGRLGPLEAALKEGTRWRFPLALVARRLGRGDVTARIRTVECTADKRCNTREVLVKTEVLVGAP